MSTASLQGSCLCGSISYTVTGDAERFYHCHCSRCRKASGTGHCSNILTTNASVAWRGDESNIGRYKLPDAERFQTAFCNQCGSPLPRYIESMQLAVIPAGSLDSEPPLEPQARIFTGSRADWSCNEATLQSFDEYPS